MSRITIQSQVDGAGVLTLKVPIGLEEANREVQVTIESMPDPQSQEQWQAFVLSTAGAIPDATFVRHEQGEYEQRETLR